MLARSSNPKLATDVDFTLKGFVVDPAPRHTVTLISGNGVSVLFGNEDGTLRAYESAGGPSGAHALAGEDFDADGFVDLATAHGPNLVTVRRNTGEERFTGAGSYAVGGTPVALVAADVDSDGLTDLVTANRGANDVSVLLGADDGQFEQQFRIRRP